MPSHVFFDSTVAPTIGLIPRSSMYGVCLYHWNDMEAIGVVGNASIMPVVSPVSTSVMAMARGWKPLALYHCVIESSPADVYSFARFRSATACTGCFEKTCSQPPWPQCTRTKPFAATRCFSSGVSVSTTSLSSS